MTEYPQEWLRCRSLTKQLIASYVAAFSSLFLLHFSSVFIVLFVLSLAFGMYATHRLATWPCPRCDSRFFKKDLYHRNFFTDSCVHCGLRKYERDA